MVTLRSAPLVGCRNPSTCRRRDEVHVEFIPYNVFSRTWRAPFASRRALSRPTGFLAWLPVTGSDPSRQPAHGIEPLLSLDEVTHLLHISESGVYRLVRNRELARVKVGGRTLFEPSEIRRFIARRRDGRENTRQGPSVPGLEVLR